MPRLLQRYLLALLLGLVGLWLNEARVSFLTEGTPLFLLGEAAVMVSFVSLGTGAGLLSAAVSLIPLMDPHDATTLVTGAYAVEAWAACLLFRRFGSLVFADTLYWFAAGWILDAALYGGVIGLSADYVTLLFIKQVFNGILSALAAEAVLRLPGVGAWLPARDSILLPKLKQYVFSRVVFVVMIPTLALAALYTHTAYDGQVAHIQERQQRRAQEVGAAVRELLSEREGHLDRLARRIETGGALRRVVPGSILDAFRAGHPEFLDVGVADARGRLAGAAHRTVSGEAWFRAVEDLQRPYVGPLVASEGGPGVVLARPLLGPAERFDGLVFGLLPPSAFLSLLAAASPDPGELVTLLDQGERVIVSRDARLPAGTLLQVHLPRATPPLEISRSFSYYPPRDGSVGSRLGIDLRYASAQKLSVSGWEVLVERPAAALYRDVMPTAYRILLFIVITLLLIYAVVARFAVRVSRPLLAINAAATDIAAGRFPGESSLEELARNPIDEIQSVAFHFLNMQDALAYRDALTGLPNRQLFLDRLGLAVAQARRSRESLAVLFLDLDRFRVVGDSLGHATGNALLRQVGERLQSTLRQGDTVARVGGDEFAVLVREVAQAEDAVRVARKLLDGLRAPFALNGRELFLTASLGASFYPNDGEVPEALLKNADTAMYRAKAEGRDTYRLYAASMNDRALEQLALESALRKALGQGEFVVHYQPLVDLRSGRVEGAEALVRWQHPDLGLLGADQFIALAESSGIILSIDAWVMRTACARAREWRALYDPGMKVEVNLSARQFQQPDLVSEVTRCLEETGLPPQSLEIEITERTAMRDVALSVETLRALRGLGVRISLDDFGTGYSSLSYLKTLPVDTVKLDQSFVRDVATDPGDAAIATAVIAMAHSLDLRVVAEGVETHDQLDFLRRQGCDAMQGHLFSGPMPAERLEAVLSRQLVSPQAD